MHERGAASSRYSTAQRDNDLSVRVESVIRRSGNGYQGPRWSELRSALEDPKLDRQKLSTLSLYICEDRTRNFGSETTQSLLDRDAAAWMEYLRGRLHRAQQSFTADSTQLLLPLVTLLLRFCGAEISPHAVPFGCFSPDWTLGDAMDHLSQALGYQPQTSHPPATFEADEMMAVVAKAKIFGQESPPDAAKMIREFIRFTPFGVPAQTEVGNSNRHPMFTLLTRIKANLNPWLWGRLDIKSLQVATRVL
jgi:hypothetical protein